MLDRNIIDRIDNRFYTRVCGLGLFLRHSVYGIDCLLIRFVHGQ
jgi:hypothetical protein